VQHSYNAYGYLESVTDTSTSTDLEEFTSVDAFGNITQETFGNGVTTARAFDAKTGRLTDIDTEGSTVLQDEHYAWQSNGILESRTRDHSTQAITETFVHDGLNRLTSATTDLSTDRVLTTSYDLRGNLQQKISSVGGDTNVTDYEYLSDSNRIDTVDIGADTYSLDYDDYGNVTLYDRTSGDDKFIDWNARNLPERITIGTSASTTTPTARDEFEYGPDGQRYYKKSTWQDGSDQWVEHTFYVGNLEELITDTKDTSHKAVQKSRIGDSVLHVKTIDYFNVTDSSIEYLHRDHLGSVAAVTDESGAELRVLGFDPYGERRRSDWTLALTPTEVGDLADDLRKSTSRGYTGHEHLDRTGFVHMNGRVYDPQLGRFLSPDPVVQSPGDSQSWNRYAYVMNSPLSYTDPSGYYRAAPMCGGMIMCANDDSNGSGSGRAHTSVRSSRTYYAIDVYIAYSRSSIYVPGQGSDDNYDPIINGGYADISVSVRVRVYRETIRREVALPDDSLTESPIGLADVAGAVIDFIPIISDLKGFYEAYKDPTVVNIAAAVLGVFGPVGDVAGKLLKRADRIAKAADRVSDLAKKDVPNSVTNPFGSKGKPDHQAKVDELAARARGEAGPGETVLTERRIQGHASRRNPDVQIVDSEGKARKIFEAERHPTYKRNRMREQEYDNLGIQHETHGLD
jgi:RHS repeat-associated protein